MARILEECLIVAKSMRLFIVNLEKIIAGVFAGAGSLLLIYEGYIAEACAILGGMLGFFVGDWNGQKKGKERV